MQYKDAEGTYYGKLSPSLINGEPPNPPKCRWTKVANLAFSTPNKTLLETKQLYFYLAEGTTGKLSPSLQKQLLLFGIVSRAGFGVLRQYYVVPILNYRGGKLVCRWYLYRMTIRYGKVFLEQPATNQVEQIHFSSMGYGLAQFEWRILRLETVPVTTWRAQSVQSSPLMDQP
jgi:hypothetical protein